MSRHRGGLSAGSTAPAEIGGLHERSANGSQKRPDYAQSDTTLPWAGNGAVISRRGELTESLERRRAPKLLTVTAVICYGEKTEEIHNETTARRNQFEGRKYN